MISKRFSEASAIFSQSRSTFKNMPIQKGTEQELMTQSLLIGVLEGGNCLEKQRTFLKLNEAYRNRKNSGIEFSAIFSQKSDVPRSTVT